MRALAFIAVTFVVAAAAIPLSAQEVTTESESPEEAAPPLEQPFATQPVFPTSPGEGTPIAGNRLGIVPFAADLPFGHFLQITAGIDGGYDDNVNNLPTGSASWFTSGNLLLEFLSNGPRLQLSLSLGTGLTYYWADVGRDYDPNLHLRASLSYRLTERLTLDLHTFNSYQGQPDYSTEFTLQRRRGNFFRSLDTISLSYRLTARLRGTTTYNFSVLQSQDSGTRSGDRIQQSVGEQLRFLLFPSTALSGHYSISSNTFQTGGGNSISQFFSGSIEQTFTKQVKAFAQAGLQYRTPESGGDRVSPFFETRVDYALAERALLTWSTRYSIEEVGGARASGRDTFRTHLQARYLITGRTSADLLLSYTHGDTGSSSNTRSSGTRDTIDVAPSVRYALNERISFHLGYRHTEVDRGNSSGVRDNGVFGSFSRNRYFAGVNVTF